MYTLYTFPSEIISHLFSFLDVSDLGAASQVCKDWNVIQKSDYIWKAIYERFLTENKQLCLPSGSWKERFRMLHNMLAGHTHLQKFECLFKTWHKHHDFTLIGEELVEVRPPMHYRVVAIAISTQLNYPLSSWHVDNIICTDVCETTWTALDASGALLCCDIAHGQVDKLVDSEHPQAIQHGHICCTQAEILTETAGKIKLWNRVSRAVETTINLEPQEGEVWALQNAHRHIICHTYMRPYNHQTFAIHKKSHRRQQLADPHFTASRQIAAAESHVAILGHTGILNIFREDENKLKLIYTINAFNSVSTYAGSLRFYHNWLVASKSGVLKIINLFDGCIISTINHNMQNVQFCLNSHKLCLQAVIGDPHFHQTYTYLIYDSAKPAIPEYPCTTC